MTHGKRASPHQASKLPPFPRPPPSPPPLWTFDAPADRDHTFFAQPKTHAAKPRNHLRRTAVLDPVATYFVYDFVLRNYQGFNPIDSRANRKAFGYRFEAGAPVPVHKAFQDFSGAVDEGKLKYQHCLSFDIASYFNALYHHDLAHWLLGVPGISEDDAGSMAKFLREANSGRSIDCLSRIDRS